MCVLSSCGVCVSRNECVSRLGGIWCVLMCVCVVSVDVCVCVQTGVCGVCVVCVDVCVVCVDVCVVC